MNKSDFPIFKANPRLIYLDSAATSQKPKAVIDAVRDFYEKNNAPIHRGMYPLAEQATQMFEDARQEVAKFIGARAEEIVFTKSATESLNIVANSLQEGLGKRSEIVLPVLEHHANLVPWQIASEETGARLVYVGLKDGKLDTAALLAAISKKTKVLAIALASNVTGELLPLRQIIAKAKARNPKLLVVVDAAQAVGRTDVNFKQLGADFLAFSAHKAYAPAGVGVLVAKKERHGLLRPLLTGGHMVHSVTREKTTFAPGTQMLEAGSPPGEGVIGLAAAVKYIQKIGLAKIRQHEIGLVEHAMKKLQKVPGIRIAGPKDAKKRVGLVSFWHEKIHAHDIASILGSEGIAARAGHHCAMPLHEELGTPATVRFSFGIYTEKKDIDKAVKILKNIVKIAK